MKIVAVRPVCLVLFFALQCLTAGGQSLPAKNILDAVYSDAQALRGKALYDGLCAACHGSSLEGVSAPELTGARFAERWREGTLDNLFDFIRQRMPFGRRPNAPPIPDKDYLDMTTYILKANGYPAGSAELEAAMLPAVMFVGKNGPQPVPDGALVITLGCLSQSDNGTWMLLSATEPARTPSLAASPAELEASRQKKLGSLTFRLADLEAVPGFAPDAHKDHRMVVKGYIVRQPNAERINLSSIEMLDAACR